MNAVPRVARIVLYKHGIAYVERRGAAASQFDLAFRRSEMNDVLKSLAVGVADGGAALRSVSYDAPTDPTEDLVQRNLAFSDGQALTGLLRSARGRRVIVSQVDGEVVTGDVVGVEETDLGTAGRRDTLILRIGVNEDEIAMVHYTDIRGVTFADQQTQQSLSFLIDRSRAATVGDNRTVTVALSAPADDVQVSYVIEAPVWRVTYRLICDGDDVSLVAIAIVANPVDEDIDDVELILTTGRPISFDINLYQDRRVRRVTVDEVQDWSEPPVAYGIAEPVPVSETGLDVLPGPPSGARSRSAVRAMAKTVAPATEWGDGGEYFEYRVTEGVSLRRGGASMVPLVSSSVGNPSRERIWRDGGTPEPDIVLAFTNTTGAVLEAGPAVVYDENTCAGEAMMSFTPRGAKVLLAFGKDMAIKCSRTTEASTTAGSLRFGSDQFIEESRREYVHTLRVENTGDEDQQVIIEIDRDGDTPVTAGRFVAPFEQTATHFRYRVLAPANEVVEVTAATSAVTSSRIHSFSFSSKLFSLWQAGGLLDGALTASLSEVLEHWGRARAAELRVEKLNDEATRVAEHQGGLVGQLEVLHDSGPEGEVRAATVAKLVAAQNRTEETAREIARERQLIDDERALGNARLAELFRRHGTDGPS